MKCIKIINLEYLLYKDYIETFLNHLEDVIQKYQVQ